MKEPLVILVAEDSEKDMFLLTRAFRKTAIEAKLQFVSDGKFAIDYLSGTENFADRDRYPLPHIAFFDINMPRLTGLEALEWVRKDPKFKVLPVLIISSSSQESDIKRAYELGASGYAFKPGDINDLVPELIRFVDFWIPHVKMASFPQPSFSFPQPASENDFIKNM